MTSKTISGYVTIILATVLTVVLIVYRPFAVEAVYPIENAWRTLCNQVVVRIGGAFKGSAAAAENRRLKQQLSALSVIRIDMERLERENDELRKSLDFVRRQPGRWMAARVLSTGGASAATSKTIRTDKGSLDGVEKNSVVVVSDGLVGLVTAVSPHTCEVTFITDEAVKVACEIESPEGKGYGILSGGGEEFLTLKHFKSAGEVLARSKVLTSGRGGMFPRGIEVGTFNGERRKADRLTCEGEVLPSVDFATLEDVFIRRER